MRPWPSYGTCCRTSAGLSVRWPRLGVRRSPRGQQPPDALLGVGYRRRAVHHGLGHLEHGIAARGFLLKAPREPAAPDVFHALPEARQHGLAIHLERPGEAAEDGRRPVVLRGPEETCLPKGPEHDFHFP